MTPSRIAIFAATSGHSGVDRIIRNLAPELARRGVAVDILKVDDHGPDLQQIHEGVRVVRLGHRHANTSLLALVSYLRRERPDALLSDKDRVNRTALRACRLARVPTRRVVRFGTTVSVNLAGKSRWERWAQAFSIRHFYRHADAVVVPSHGVKTDLVTTYGLPPEQIHVIANPVVTPQLDSLAREDVVMPWPDTASTPVVVGVGEHSQRKDFATLVRAFAAIREERPCRLLLVGVGRETPALRRLGEELGLQQDIAFTGFVDNPYPYIARSAVLALTSRWEGMGVVLAEALALGVQVVSTDCPNGPREVLQDGRAGHLARVGDVDDVARGLRHALDHPIPRETVLAAAEPYHVEQSANAYLQVLGLPAKSA